MGCRKEKLGRDLNSDFLSSLSVSLLQSEVSAFRAEPAKEYRQDEPNDQVEFVEKLGNAQNADFLSVMPVSLLQAEVSSIRTVEKHKQGNLPNILNKAASVASTSLPTLGSSQTTPGP